MKLAHGAPPETVPAWLEGGVFEGLIAVPDGDDVRIAARAAAAVGEPGIVVVDLLVGDSVVARIAGDTVVEVREVRLVPLEPDEAEQAVDATPSGTAMTSSRRRSRPVSRAD